MIHCNKRSMGIREGLKSVLILSSRTFMSIITALKLYNCVPGMNKKIV